MISLGTLKVISTVCSVVTGIATAGMNIANSGVVWKSGPDVLNLVVKTEVAKAVKEAALR